MRRWLALAGATSLLAGCSTVTGWFSSADTGEPPAPLVDFQPSLSVRTLWSYDAGASGKDRILALRAAVRGGRVAVADPKGQVTLLDADTGTSLWEVDIRAPASAGPTLGEGWSWWARPTARSWAWRPSPVRSAGRRGSPAKSCPHRHRPRRRGRALARRPSLRARRPDRSAALVYEKGVPILSLRGTGDPVVAASWSWTVSTAVAWSRWPCATAARSGGPRRRPARRSDLDRMIDIDSAPVVVGDAVYVVSFHGQVAALELTSGRPAWQNDMSSSAGLAVDARYVYVSDEQSHVWASTASTAASPGTRTA